MIAFRGGGYLESVIEGKTGLFLDELSVNALATVLKKFDDSNHRTFKENECRQQAQNFSKKRFIKEIKKFVAKKVR